MLRLQMLERGMNPRTVEPEEAAVFAQLWKRNGDTVDPDAAIEQAAMQEDATYSVKLKYLRLLRVSDRHDEANLYARRVALRHPKAAGEPYSPECSPQHNEVLQWLKT